MESGPGPQSTRDAPNESLATDSTYPGLNAGRSWGPNNEDFTEIVRSKTVQKGIPDASTSSPAQSNSGSNEKSWSADSPSSQQEPGLISSDPEGEHIYQEGGLRAWLVVFGSWCGMFASLGIANTLASFEAYFSQNQLVSYPPGKIGWIFSIYAFLSCDGGLYLAPLFDVYGPFWLVFPGSVLVVLDMFLLGICTGKSRLATSSLLQA